MEVTYLLLFSLACLQISLTNAVADGKPVSIEQLPYQASLILNVTSYDGEKTIEEVICGAAILNAEWIVTAGHCLESTTFRGLKVRTGATKRYNDGQEHDIKTTIMHPDYEPNDEIISNDIGLIQLSQPIQFNKVQKSIALETSRSLGGILTISGYGKEEEPKEVNDKDQLKATDLTIDPASTCQKAYPNDPITDKIICAGKVTNSFCNGDAGGPGVINGRLAAIILTGIDCDNHNLPAVFLNINKYRDWIGEYVKN